MRRSRRRPMVLRVMYKWEEDFRSAFDLLLATVYSKQIYMNFSVDLQRG